jgi:hypothetical protein
MRCKRRVWLLFVTAVAWAQEPSHVAPLRFDAASVKQVQLENPAQSRITPTRGD